MRILYSTLVLFILLAAGCKPDGNVLLPDAPDTRLEFDSIILNGAQPWQTKLTMRWLGNSKTSIVTGYRVMWTYGPIADPVAELAKTPLISRSDSAFRFTISENKNRIWFYAQAFDRNGQGDPSPALLILPLRNTPPVLKIQASSMAQTDSVTNVITIPWTGSDLDGDDTWDTVEVKANNGNWVSLPKGFSLLSIVAENPASPAEGNAIIYGGAVPVLITKNAGGISTPVKLSGWKPGAINTVYMRNRDQSRAYSKTDSTKPYFVTLKKSDLMVINANSGKHASGDPAPFDVYGPALASAAPLGYDYWDLVTGGGKNLPYYPIANMQVTLGLYKKVVFLGEVNKSLNKRDTTQLVLEYHAGALLNYKNNGGKLLIISRLPTRAGALPSNSTFYALIPVTGFLGKNDPDLRIYPGDASLVPALNTGYPEMPYTGRSALTGLDVFNIQGNGEQAFTISKITVSPVTSTWSGGNTMALRQRYDNGKLNYVFIAADLQLFNAPGKVNTLFDKILNDDFNW
ncbi:MAG: hypothetical protein V4543_12540 [Bacteroidota bacterium]